MQNSFNGSNQQQWFNSNNEYVQNAFYSSPQQDKSPNNMQTWFIPTMQTGFNLN